MQQTLIKITRGLSSPAILIAAVWCATLISVAIGPVVFPSQPSVQVLMLVAVGVSLFIAGERVGAWCYRTWSQFLPKLPASPVSTLNVAVVTTAMLGLAGIALIAFDRVVLSGVSASGYAELLRCAPILIDLIEIKRTPLLYIGYLTFSFSFASFALFILKGEEVRGWPAGLAQLSLLCPVGYALLYSGRMPILLVIVLGVAAVLVRIGQGRRPLPGGHYLLVKTIAVLVLFGIYSNSVWSSRRNFCSGMGGLVLELQAKAKARSLANAQQEPLQPGQTQSSGGVSAVDLSKMIEEKKVLPGRERQYSADFRELPLMKREVWHTSPRGYVLSALQSGWLSPDTASNLLNTYFYLTHGVFVLGLAWEARAQFSPHWGIYEIGVLSPILRVFVPQNQQLLSMSTELKAAGISGFFPTAWGAAYIDFGAVGGVIYILIWGFAAGWAFCGTRRSDLMTPPLLLTFLSASILLSPVQGPLGIANSALVLVSMTIVGIAIDLGNLRSRGGRAGEEPKVACAGPVSAS